MKNYSSSYNGWGIQLWKDVHKEKVTDALFSYGHWDKDPINRIAHKSSILGISQKHKLVRLCAETGTVLESIFLSQIYKFKSIYWDDPHYTAVISSSKVQTQDQSNCPGSMMKAIALFNVFPLEFVGMFAIEKEIFGNDLHDALVSDNLLVTNKRGGIVELFSVDYILEHFLLYKASLYEPDPVTGHIVGMHPFGIPFNIKFKALPPVLLRIKTEDHDVQFGGFPYHMILAAPSQYGVFYIKTLYDEEMIQNGRLDLGNGHSVDTDTAIFHPDRPSKILHYGGTRVRVLSMADDGYSNKCIQLQKEISSTRNSMICASRETITRSGRQIKPTSTNIQQYERKVEEIFYDSELDIFAVLTKDHNDFFSCPPNACLEIYDNETCTYLRSIDVDIPDNAIELNFSLHLGTIIQLCKTRNIFTCDVYNIVEYEDV